MSKSKRFTFSIPIGDWSDDGHGKTATFYATAAKPIEAVREAYFAVKAKLPDACCPESFCDEYEEPEMAPESRTALISKGCEVPDEIGVDAMANIVVWFLNQGDPELDVKLNGKPLPVLPFYGFDPKKRHIGFIGYGLFSWPPQQRTSCARRERSRPTSKGPRLASRRRGKKSRSIARRGCTRKRIGARWNSRFSKPETAHSWRC